MGALPPTSCDLFTNGGLMCTVSRFPSLIAFLILGCGSEPVVAPDAPAATRPDFLVRNPQDADLNNNGLVCRQGSSESSGRTLPNWPGVYLDDVYDEFVDNCPPSYTRISI